MYDIFSNPKLKAIMTVYVMMMGFDLFGRVMLPSGETVPAAQSNSTQTETSGTSSITTDRIPENGDAIPIDRSGFGPGGSKPGVNVGPSAASAHVHVSYCVGCQMNGAFKQFEELLKQQGIEYVTAEEYPIAAPLKLLGTAISYSHWAILVFLMAGEQIFRYFGMTPHPLYYKAKEKQWMVIIASYFLTSQLSSFLLNSGAFEVYLNDELLFSKLASKKMPDPTYLLSLVHSRLK